MSSLTIHTIKVPNPFFEGRNAVYVIEADPITIIDTGVATEKAWGILVDGLEKIQVPLESIRRIILTHKHIDHIGNAWRIHQRSDAEVFIHESEVRFVQEVDPSSERYAELVASRLDEWSIPAAKRPSRQSKPPPWLIEACPAKPLVDGQELPIGDQAIEVIHTPGHTFGSICLRLENSLFSGDHVLPGISPNIGGGDLRHRGLLSKYLESLERIRGLDRVGLTTLPGHGNPMRDKLAERCDRLISHHDKRLGEVLEILASSGTQTVYEVAEQLFGEMEDFHVILGCAEGQAHLDLLVDREQVTEQDGGYALV